MFRIKQNILSRLVNYINSYSDVQIHVDPSVKIKSSRVNRNVEINKRSEVSNSKISGNVIIGEESIVRGSIIQGNIRTKNNCRIYKCIIKGNIDIGKYTSLWGPNLDIVTGKYKVSIGNFCSIARNVSFQAYNHNTKKITTYFIGKNFFKENWDNEFTSKGDIIIENDVWIGSHSVILSGVKIGNGAIVAANSVVTKNVEPYSIVAGTPAKIISYRFDKNTIESLIDLKWWDWSDEKIMKNKKLFINEYTEDDYT